MRPAASKRNPGPPSKSPPPCSAQGYLLAQAIQALTFGVVCLMRLILLWSDHSKFRKTLRNNYLSQKTSRNITSCLTSRDFGHSGKNSLAPCNLGKFRKYPTKKVPWLSTSLYHWRCWSKGLSCKSLLSSNWDSATWNSWGFGSLDLWKPQIFSLRTLSPPKFNIFAPEKWWLED